MDHYTPAPWPNGKALLSGGKDCGFEVRLFSKCCNFNLDPNLRSPIGVAKLLFLTFGDRFTITEGGA